MFHLPGVAAEPQFRGALQLFLQPAQSKKWLMTEKIVLQKSLQKNLQRRKKMNIIIVSQVIPEKSIRLHHFLHLQLHRPASWSWKCISFHFIVIVMMIVLLPKHNVAPCKTSHQLIGIYAFPWPPFSHHQGQGQGSYRRQRWRGWGRRLVDTNLSILLEAGVSTLIIWPAL